MAESLKNSDPNKSNDGEEDSNRVRRKSGKSQPPKQDNTDRSDKLFGFLPFRFSSLRNLFGSWRRGSLEEVSSKEDRRSSSPPKSKSTENIFSDSKGAGKPPRPKAPPSREPSVKSSQALGRQLSASADNLISPANQLSSAASQGAISNRSGSKASTLDTSNDELNNSTELVDDFFADKWTHIRIDNKTRSLSSSDADEADREVNFDLDAIRKTKGLDVSVCKDRILIKPKGKKLTQAMQEKVKTAEMDVKPAIRVQLHSVAEVDEEELFPGEPRRKAQKEDDAAGDRSCPQSPNQEATSPLPEAPPRRKKSLDQAKGDKSGYRKTIGIEITPSMLSGALKKTTPDRDGSFSRTRPEVTAVENSTLVPPLDGIWKRRQEKTATVAPNSFESQGATTSNGSLATTGDTAMVVASGGGAGGEAGGGGGSSSVQKRNVVSCSEDDNENKGARPKEPPKTRPKTRPKTMLHPIGASSTQQQLSD